MYYEFALCLVPVADCADGDIRVRNDSNMIRGELQYCDNKAWFFIPWSSYWYTLPWNRDLVCKSLGHPFSGQYFRYNKLLLLLLLLFLLLSVSGKSE